MRAGRNIAVRRRGFSILEVLVALAILTAGMLTIMALYPTTLRAQRDAELLSEAAALAQMKAEEIRLLDSADGVLVAEIESLTTETETERLVFPNESRLTYSYCGATVMYAELAAATPGDPRVASNVARVIIRYASEFRPTQDVIYELRFK